MHTWDIKVNKMEKEEKNCRVIIEMGRRNCLSLNCSLMPVIAYYMSSSAFTKLIQPRKEYKDSRILDVTNLIFIF